MKPAIPTKTRIREVRKARGFTLKQLAAKIGTTPQTCQRLETDNMTVSLNWLYAIASALDIEPYQLLPHPQEETTPEGAFVKCLRDAVIYNRRHVPSPEDVPLVMMEALGKLSGLIVECRKGLRPWDDAYAQALAVAAGAMRIAVDGGKTRAGAGRELMETAA